MAWGMLRELDDDQIVVAKAAAAAADAAAVGLQLPTRNGKGDI